MRIFKLAGFIFILFICSCDQKNDEYLERALNDFSMHSHFVFLEITNGESQRNIVIENLELFSALALKNDLDENSYKDFVKKSLKTKKPVMLENLDQFKSTDIPKHILSMRKSAFIAKYFDKKGLLKDKYLYVSDEIAANCFLLKILCRPDGETGYLMIESRI